MGVCVQEMVQADAAGVFFTRDPVTGNPGVMTINVSYGLGEVGSISFLSYGRTVYTILYLISKFLSGTL